MNLKNAELANSPKSQSHC